MTINETPTKEFPKLPRTDESIVLNIEYRIKVGYNPRWPNDFPDGMSLAEAIKMEKDRSDNEVLQIIQDVNPRYCKIEKIIRLD